MGRWNNSVRAPLAAPSVAKQEMRAVKLYDFRSRFGLAGYPLTTLDAAAAKYKGAPPPAPLTRPPGPTGRVSRTGEHLSVAG